MMLKGSIASPVTMMFKRRNISAISKTDGSAVTA